ncbi:MAG TPA: hypothetical protein ENO20_10840 [Bacteroides sp.]|nr:hypothetical protein [Bacteroides sp.]
MGTTEKTIITVESSLQVPVERVWKLWTEPLHIMHWNNASDDWHTTRAENDLRDGGMFLYRMEARDGSSGFDFTGRYSLVDPHWKIAYTLDDGRQVQVTFVGDGSKTRVHESFEAEQTYPPEVQEEGWHAILENFRKYAENSDGSEAMHFEISVRAPVGKVYRTMLEDRVYRNWTSVFNPGSHFNGSWKKGSKMLFLGCDPEGNLGGMVSRIRENIPDRFVSIEHLGIVQGKKEITKGPEVEGWAGALENYSLTDHRGDTLLSVDLDVRKDFMSYFRDTWPRALDRLKTICETG